MSSSRVVLAALVMALAVGSTATLNAQGMGMGMKVDTLLAARGKKVWNNKQCFGCHELGRMESTGPDLIGVTDRRSVEWLRSWLHNPVDMTSEDSIAAGLKKQYNAQMPNMKLTKEEVEALINYLAQQTQLHAGK
jgi:cbb3-type cytochrome oxidase cytochrome c subunit